jgi:hypothetical protein
MIGKENADPAAEPAACIVEMELETEPDATPTRADRDGEKRYKEVLL